MEFHTCTPEPALSLFVKSILVFENTDASKKTVLPFYADGYPGLLYHRTPNGMHVLPQGKKMPELFLYGQTIHPIELQIEGNYRFIVFQLYPFVLKSFFGLSPIDLNDDCFDLSKPKHLNGEQLLQQLEQSENVNDWQNQLTAFLTALAEKGKEKNDPRIQQAIGLIIEQEGRGSIKAVRDALNITERTFERLFLSQTGVSPKQFSRIIQFQHSLDDITKNEYALLTDIVYKNGYADQSHFIRVFKSFTGKTPTQFKAEL